MITHFIYFAHFRPGGVTLHGAFDFKFGNEHRSLNDQSLARFRENLKHLKVLIVDEVSLLGSDMLYKIHSRLCEIFQKDISQPFANISVILVGDLMQLPPVNARYVFKSPSNKHFLSFHQAISLWKTFEPHILEQNHRQGEASEWVNTLNRFRIGSINNDDKELLKSRVTKEEHLNENTMHIFFTNLEVSNHNDKMLNKIEAELLTIKAKLSGRRPKITPDGRVGDTQFFECLNIKVGARCVLTWNVSTVDELVNGSSGTIIGIERNKMSKERRIEAIIVKFDDETAGKMHQQKHSRLSMKYQDLNGTPIVRHELEFNIQRRSGSSHAATGKVEQFPLRIFYASTAHRMQGQTIRSGCKVAIHWTKKMQNEPGMAYVMLGRSEKLEDIHIIGDIDFDSIKCSLPALEESKRLYEMFQVENQERLNFRRSHFIITYINIRSLKCHLKSVVNDSFLMSSDLLGFGETWLSQDERVTIDGFCDGVYANNGRGKGLAAYSKSELMNATIVVTKDKVSLIKIITDEFDVLFLYASNGCDQKHLCSLLEESMDMDNATAVLGDFNIEYQTNSKLKQFMDSKKCSQLIKHPTFDSGSLIDHVYINEKMGQFGVKSFQHSVYYSDHDYVSILIRK